VLLIHDVRHWELLNDDRSTRRIAEFIQGFCGLPVETSALGAGLREPKAASNPAETALLEGRANDAGREQRMSSS
jgi:hypothetical protein